MKKNQKAAVMAAKHGHGAVNIVPEEVWGIKEVEKSQEVLLMLAKMRQLNTTVASTHQPLKLARLLHHTATEYTKWRPNSFDVLEGAVVEAEIQLIIRFNRRVVGIRMQSAEWHKLLRQAKSVSTRVSA